MPRWRHSSEEQPELSHDLYVWPWEEEVINTAEYTRSLQSLDHFLTTVDIPELHNLDDLSAVASLVGHDLRVITIFKGAKIENRTEFLSAASQTLTSSVETYHVLTTWKRDLEVMVTAGQGSVVITEKSLAGFQHFARESLRVKLPSDRDITIGGHANVNELELYALDVRNSYMREYLPVKEPDNPEIQQGFTSILKDALKDVRDLILTR